MFIREFIDVNNDINYQYRTSKYPLVIKNLILNRNRKKLKKMVNRLNKDNIPISLLREYYDMIILNYPPLGQYQHISSCKYSYGDQYAAYYQFNDEQIEGTSYIVSVGLNGESNTLYANFVVEEINKLGVSQNRFYKEYNEVIGKNKSTNISIEEEKINDILSKFVDIIIGDIKHFLMDIIERSERISL